MTSPGQIDRQSNPGLAVHVICDNLSAHKAPVVRRSGTQGIIGTTGAVRARAWTCGFSSTYLP